MSVSWTSRDLQILAEGMLIGGRYNLSSVSGYAPKVWNIEGEYSILYMDFRKLLADFSPAQFMECVKIYGGAGEVKITNAEKVPGSDMVVRVTCDLSRETQGINIYGRSNSWLTWRNGTAVPVFVVYHAVAGLDTTLPLAYVFERGVVRPAGLGAEGPTALTAYWGAQTADIVEEGVMAPPALSGAESVGISYS